MFDSESIPALIKTYKEKWEEFRQALINDEFQYFNLEKAKEITFLSVLDNMLQYEKENNIIKIPFIVLNRHYSFCRATELDKIKDKEPLSIERFLPNKDYIKDDNRFSPKGIEYLYLACKARWGEEKNYKYIEEVAMKEVRAKDEKRYGMSKFRIPEKLQTFDKNIIDLTIADNKSFEEIEKNFISQLKDAKTKEARHSEVEKLALKIYFKLMSEELFKPIKTDDKSNQYKPFHCLAEYFKQLGFDGVMFKSTVCNNGHGKNIVLFDKYYAEPFEYAIIDMPYLEPMKYKTF